MNGELLVLPRNCSNCQHFDGEGWCALPAGADKAITGFIRYGARVTCTKHEPQDADDVEGAAV